MRKIFLAIIVLALVSPSFAEAANDATGDALVYTVMVSDSDNTFDQGMIDVVKDHMGEVEEYYEGNSPSQADLDLIMEYQEPSIQFSGDYGESYDYVEKSLNQLGYEGNKREATKDLVDSKEAEGYENVALLLVVPDSGRSFMVPSGDTEFTTVFYYQWDNSLAELVNLDDTPSVVYAHELGHIFGAEDEYYEEGNTGYGELSNNPTEKLQRLYPSFNYENGPSVEQSIMATYGVWDAFGWFDINTPFSKWARGMIGWRDFDLDGILDPNDDKIPVNFPSERLPILNAGIDKGTQVKYTEFDEVTARAQYDDASLVEEFGFRLESPDGQTTDQINLNATSYEIQSAELDAIASDAEKPGNWTINFLFGDERAAWYEIEVTAPLVHLPTEEVDFGRVNVENQERGVFRIENQGKMQLDARETEIITGENVVEGLDEFSVDLLSSSSQSFVLSPSDTGEIDGQVSFETNDPRNEEVSLSLSGFAYAVRNIGLSEGETAKVGEDVGVDIVIHETDSKPEEYDVSVDREEGQVNKEESVSLRKEKGEAILSFDKYGDYNVTVDKEDTREFVYNPDSTLLEIERIVKNLQLEMDLSSTKVKPEETVEVIPKVNGESVEAELTINGESYGVKKQFDVELAEPGEYTLEITKSEVKTDRERRKYSSDRKTITVEERSIVEKISYFFSKLFD